MGGLQPRGCQAFAACLTDDWREYGPEHEMMFNRVRDGRVATTWAMTAGPGFYEQLTGRRAPEAVDNLG